ncbi:hypothetical protein [Streptomyces scopuliridis]|uniref:Uncharacterized protein n=1 Tax=Streptomyces scopuliridis TaxID=452529 RepID=A0ACD4ZSS1_9ACTN|nr:hypothetical protein [Streptomyces scopuliridis]WSC01270.1 hypothetical protein OG835_32590 [Streptomyces scopuliridis]
MKVYERTENDIVTRISVREALAEVNNAMMEGKRQVRTMSSGRGQHSIEYKDGRKVTLIEVDAPAPEGYTQGQAVVVQRPGRAPVTGTVAHIHTAPGYVAVLDDRYRAVSNHPASFVSATKTDEEPAQATVEAPTFDEHVISYNGGKVHTAMPGMDDHSYPLCRGGGQNQNLTKFRPTTAPLSCKTCVGYAEGRAVAAREGN